MRQLPVMHSPPTQAPHKVNLNAPQKAILVNIVKSVCGVAVVQRFKELCRYNIRTVAMPEAEREALREEQRQQQKVSPAPAAEAEAAAAPAEVKEGGEEAPAAATPEEPAQAEGCAEEVQQEAKAEEQAAAEEVEVEAAA